MEHRTKYEPLRILLVLTEFPPSIGGMQAHAIYLSRFLADRGYLVEVVTYRPSSIEERKHVQCFDNDLEFPIHRSLSRLAFWYNIMILERVSRQFKPDLIYCSTIFYGFLRDIVNVPIVCRSAGNDELRPWIAYPFRLASHLLATPRLENWLYNTFKKMEYPELVDSILRKKRMKLVKQSAHRILAFSFLALSASLCGVITKAGSVSLGSGRGWSLSVPAYFFFRSECPPKSSALIGQAEMQAGILPSSR